MTATLTPTSRPIGTTQVAVLALLKGERTGLVATAVRDAADLGAGDFGTRRAHAILKRLEERGYVEKETMTQKVAAKVAAEQSGGRKSKHRFKITADGRVELKAALKLR